MPPRIPVPSWITASYSAATPCAVNIPSRSLVSQLCFRPASNSRLPTISIANASTLSQRKKHRDPYALAQAKQRKDANLSRRAQLEEERNATLGDPVRGIPTPFVKSFDDVGGSAVTIATDSIDDASTGTQIKSSNNLLLNHFLTPAELESSIKHSYMLTEPKEAKDRYGADPAQEEEERKQHAEGHARAASALARIASLANASQKDKTRANVVRCIQTFGRHETDSILRPRALTNPDFLDQNKSLPDKTPRAGPDTGSSEVQIAILTAKIRVLADKLEAPGGKKDKINKRNLRVMIHKRQKLLKYLRRKERGSDRWQNVVDTLGLGEATWKGEISL